MVAIAALLRIRYGFASPKNRPKTEKENALFWLHFLISWFPDSFVVEQNTIHLLAVGHRREIYRER